MEGLEQDLTKIHKRLHERVTCLESYIKNMEKNRIKKGDVAIVIGHTKRQKGACSPFGIPCEWDFNKKVASYLEDIADIHYYNPYTIGYTRRVKELAKKLNKKNYKLIVELHYNAAGSSQANGTECLYYFKNRWTKELSQDFSKMFAEDFGTTIRGNNGAKALVNLKDRGFAAVYYPKAPAILVEPIFGSNRSDVNKIKGREQVYANTLRKFLIKNIK